MTRLIRFFIERYVFAFAIFLALVFFGVTAGLRLGVDLLPEFEVPVIAVSTSYPGAGSEEASRQVTEVVEDAVATLSGIDDITAISGEGFSLVIAYFNFGVDVDQAAIDVRQRIDGIQDQLPDDAGTPVIQKFDPNAEPILKVALSAPGRDLIEVQDYAERTLSTTLQQVEGVATVGVVGPVSREVQVLIDPAALQRYGLTIQQVSGAISAASLTLPAGSVDLRDERILVTFRERPASPADVEDIYVDPTRGLTVADVAVVRDTVADPAAFVRYDGEPVVLLEVSKTSGANSVSTAANLRTSLETQEMPAGYRSAIVGDTTIYVANSVRDTFRETLLAVAAVAFIVLLFVGRLGSTFSVVLAIPITITGAVIAFALLGFTFNVVTLLAITVAVGLVVDDSIVISENVARLIEQGMERKQAVLTGAGQVAVAVLTATLSLLAVFIPIAFLPGIVGQFFAQFGLALAAAIIVSYLEAMLFLTVRLAYLPNPLPPSWRDAAQAVRDIPRRTLSVGSALKRAPLWIAATALAAGLVAVHARAPLPYLSELPGAGTFEMAVIVAVTLAASIVVLAALTFLLRIPGRLALVALGALLRSAHTVTARGIDRLRDAYGRALGAALDNSGLILITAALLIGSLFVIFPRISFNFVSPVDAGIISVGLELPPGTTLTRTDDIAQRLESALEGRPEVQSIQTTVGTSGTFGRATPERANLTVDLVPRQERPSALLLAPSLETELRQLLADVPEARLEVEASDGGAVPVDTGIDVTLQSSDFTLLSERAEQALSVMQEDPYLRNPNSTLEGRVSERVFVLDRSALVGTGLTPSDIGQALRAYNVGTTAANLDQGGSQVPIVVKLDPVVIADEQALLSVPVYAPALQSYLRLSELGRFEVQAAPVSIRRGNQAFVATLSAQLAPNAPGQLQVRGELERSLAAAGIIDDDVRIGTGVGPDLLGDLVTYGPIAFALALVLNYLVIASQFNSFRYPLYLLLTVPLALVGAFWLFYLFGRPLDVISVLGVVMLIGLVTKNAILLLDVVVSQVQRHPTLRDGLIAAGRLRLRPILMTALTVMIISLPLLLGLGEGSEFRQPLGMVILGGVVSSTFLTLFVVPAAFYRFERRRYDVIAEAELALRQDEVAAAAQRS